MKKLLILTALGLAAHGISQTTPVKVGMVFDAGGKNDRSFNQSAYEGAQRAVRDLGVIQTDFDATSEGEKRTAPQAINEFAKQRYDFTAGIGYANNEAITAAAKANPNLKFGLVDDVSPAKNVASMIFKEEEGGYLVGYIAGLNTSTNRIGFVGGMEIPVIYRFAAGFKAGVRAANPKAKVTSRYVGGPNDYTAWDNPDKAYKQAADLTRQGADIIFHAAGNSGLGVIKFVKDKQCLKASQLPSGVKFTSDNFVKVPKSDAYKKACASDTRPLLFIGVDSNQNYLGDTDNNPVTLNHGLTSMVKRVDNVMYQVIKEVAEGKFKGGERLFGLKEDGVGFAMDRYNRALVPAAQVAKVAQQRAMIVSGSLKVPGR
ncbi:BMP family lipoprotein [Deinococcus ficus]|uniref:BMP family ABC transporter substrate-binding protein n=1 Tax=Deinococcus ficus TaxID=317577 RepID=A0A221T3I4_9DEIO|nr:BMP family ABC transporter substrate-binding protein [Deinococcus ficus]ASN83453.1 BMP family ABC transporter substrate-binding protein [Deinococcus ficus]